MFRTLRYYERSTIHDFAVAHFEYNHSRLLIKRLPPFADKLMREVLFFNALFAERDKPYYEFGYGLNQVFLLFDIEVVSGFSGGKHQYTGFRLGIPLSGQLSIGI